MVKLLQNKSKYIKKNITGSPHTIWKKSWLVGDSKALSWLPYSGKLSREKTSANFIVLWFAKVFFIKFGGMAKVSNPRKFSPWKSYFSPICESFFPSKVSAIQYTLTAIHRSLNSNYRRSGNFRCKNIFVVCANHEKKKNNTKYILQPIIVIARALLFAQLHSTALASYFAWDGLFDTSMSLELLANSRQLFAQCPINRLSLLLQYVPTALFGSLLHASSSPTAACSMEAVRTLSVRSFVPDH